MEPTAVNNYDIMVITEDYLIKEALSINSRAKVYYAIVDVNVKSPIKGQNVSGSFKGSWKIKTPLREQVDDRVKRSLHPLAETISFNIRCGIKHKK